MLSTLLSSSLLEVGGPVMPVILLTALVAYAIAIERLLAWAVQYARERPFYRAADAAALEVLLSQAEGRPNPPPLVAVLLAMRRLRELPPARREPALDAELLERVPVVERRLSTVGWLGTILPMLGLLGTVSGMITTFRDLAVTTSREVLSQGLSEALWTTEVGLIAAVPLLAVHHGLSRVKSRWLYRLERGLALLLAEAPPPGPAGGGAEETGHAS
jgi:biopolymer transport protein ExbB